jgi:redox-sensitive bicupin YhaK (pirin superfamily)
MQEVNVFQQSVLADLLSRDGGSKNGTRMFFYDADRLTPLTDDDLATTVPEGEREAFLAEYGSGGEITVILTSPDLTVFRYKAPPGMKVPPHHHGVHQITYMLKGELRYGNAVARPGTGLFTPGHKYQWEAGPEGAEFLEIFAGIPIGTIT